MQSALFAYVFLPIPVSCAVSLSLSLSLPLCGALAGLCPRFACAGAENEALNRFNMMPKADMKNLTFINQVGDRKMGLGLAMDSYFICTKSIYSIYQCVNELISHLSMHGSMGQWCEFT